MLTRLASALSALLIAATLAPATVQAGGIIGGVRTHKATAVPSGTTQLGATIRSATGGGETFTYSAPTMAAGDVVLLFIRNGTGTPVATLNASATAFTLICTAGNGSNSDYVFAAKLGAADPAAFQINLTSSVAATNPMISAVYHGAGSVICHDHQAVGTTSVTYAGFVPSGSTKGVLRTAFDTSSNTSVVTTSPGSWTHTYNGTSVPSATYFSGYLASQFGGYVSGTAITDAGFTTSGHSGYLLELAP